MTQQEFNNRRQLAPQKIHAKQEAHKKKIMETNKPSIQQAVIELADSTEKYTNVYVDECLNTKDVNNILKEMFPELKLYARKTKLKSKFRIYIKKNWMHKLSNSFQIKNKAFGPKHRPITKNIHTK